MVIFLFFTLFDCQLKLLFPRNQGIRNGRYTVNISVVTFISLSFRMLDNLIIKFPKLMKF